MWDVIIVGARCAGSATALRFARSGRSVLVLDSSQPGTDTLSTHILKPSAVQQIQSLGLLEALEATGAPRVHFSVHDRGNGPMANPIAEPPGFILCVRRVTLDPILVEAARADGATVRHGSHVEGLLWEDGRVVGVRGRDKSGEPSEERGRLVVGADGRHSHVARELAVPSYNQAESGAGVLYSYWQDVGSLSCGPDAVQFAAGPGYVLINCPCDGDRHVVLFAISPEEYTALLADPAGYEARLRSIPALAPRLSHARRVSRIYPANPREMPGYFRVPFGPGWALVGDAGLCPHPAGALGIAGGLRSAELLHQYVEQAWAAGEPAEARLEHYQQERDAETTESYYAGFRSSQVNAPRNPQGPAADAGRARSDLPTK